MFLGLANLGRPTTLRLDATMTRIDSIEKNEINNSNANNKDEDGDGRKNHNDDGKNITKPSLHRVCQEVTRGASTCTLPVPPQSSQETVWLLV
jgi:hypothetical protein